MNRYCILKCLCFALSHSPPPLVSFLWFSFIVKSTMPFNIFSLKLPYDIFFFSQRKGFKDGSAWTTFVVFKSTLACSQTLATVKGVL